MTEFVIPRFKDWTKPTSVLDALERSLAHARIEAKWSGRSWFETNIPVDYDVDCRITPGSHDLIVKKIESMVCTDVKACSAGIVAIETLDGEALYHFLVNGEELDSDILKADPICWGAIEVLSQAFHEEFGDAGASSLSCIIHYNDSQGFATREEHHARIVLCFERAVEMAKEQTA